MVKDIFVEASFGRVLSLTTLAEMQNRHIEVSHHLPRPTGPQVSC